MQTSELISVIGFLLTMNPKKLPYCVKVLFSLVEFTESFPTNCSVTDDCLKGDIRIRDGTHPSNGRVEVCKNGIWGSVCFSGWSDNEAAVVCRHLGHDSNDSKSTNVFGAGPPVLSAFFKCDGIEASFESCQRSVNNDFNSESCSSAGVICSREFDNATKCTTDKSIYTSEIIERFGKCEVYEGGNSVCDGVHRQDIDYVFVPKQYETQTSVAQILQGHIPSTIQLTERHCRDKLYQIICRYYLSPCGTKDLKISPTSLCPSDCQAIQEECTLDWSVVEQRLGDYSFIQCTDTKSLLFPLLSCCAELQSMQSPAPESRNTVIVLVVCFVLLVVVTAIGSAIVIIYLVLSKRRSRARAKSIQMDIMSSSPTAETEGLFHSLRSGRDRNPYCIILVQAYDGGLLTAFPWNCPLFVNLIHMKTPFSVEQNPSQLQQT
jgi:hypothetical protein